MSLASLAAAVWAVVALVLATATRLCPPWFAGVAAVCALAALHRKPVAVIRIIAAVGFSVTLAMLRVLPLVTGPVHQAAAVGAAVSAVAQVSSDAMTITATGGLDWTPRTSSLVDARTSHVTIRDRTLAVRVPIRVVLPETAPVLVPGTTVWLSGKLSPAPPGRRSSATLRASDVALVRGPPEYQWLAWQIRRHLQAAVSQVSLPSRGLVPGLVLGDTSELPSDVASDMRSAGLSHLTAVSGANVALLVGIVSALTARLPRRARFAVVLAAITMFSVVVRPSPSVLRAAVMGALGAYAVLHRERARSAQVLAAAVLALLAWDPWLALSLGFALSVAATAGLVAWGGRLASVLPGRGALANAAATTLAAQLAVLPLLVAIGSTLTIASLPANIAAVPLASVAMLSGLIVTVVSLVSPPVASALAWVPAIAAEAIARIADWAAGAGWLTVPWPTGWAGVGAATALVAVVAVTSSRWSEAPVAARSAATSLIAATVMIAVVRPSPTPELWPPRDWAVVSCDVGQGDATVVRVGRREAVVIDVGPEPRAVDACLKQLRVSTVAAVVLTHFHADHVGGLEGVLRRRAVGAVYVTALPDPPTMRAWVETVVGGRQLQVMAFPGRFDVGGVSFQCVWPQRLILGQGSDANNASIALAVHVRGATFLLPGDAEPPAQDAMLAAIGPVDVLKVAHHGSAYQSPAFAARAHPHIAVISVGRDNNYGHPSALTIALYQGVGARVLRTDRDGSVAFRVAPDGTVSARGHT